MSTSVMSPLVVPTVITIITTRFASSLSLSRLTPCPGAVRPVGQRGRLGAVRWVFTRRCAHTPSLGWVGYGTA